MKSHNEDNMVGVKDFYQEGMFQGRVCLFIKELEDSGAGVHIRSQFNLLFGDLETEVERVFEEGIADGREQEAVASDEDRKDGCATLKRQVKELRAERDALREQLESVRRALSPQGGRGRRQRKGRGSGKDDEADWNILSPFFPAQ